MSLISGGHVLAAAAVATVAVDVTVHPIDTIITRLQSPAYKTRYRQRNGLFHRSLFLGLYQGFGPTLLAGIPASAAFFSVYEGSKWLFARAHESGRWEHLPLPVAHAVSGAVADLVACAVINPAEVLKQNAQVSTAEGLPSGRRSHVVLAWRHFMRQPSRLWAGYTMLVASSLPGTSLTFSLYEWFKQKLSRGDDELSHDIPYQMKASAVSAAAAAGLSSCIFVPVDVVKTRMRLAAGEEPVGRTDKAQAVRPGPVAVARHVLRIEGVGGLFRGLTLTFIASMFGAGLYLGCYEGCKLYLGREDDDGEGFAG